MTDRRQPFDSAGAHNEKPTALDPSPELHRYKVLIPFARREGMTLQAAASIANRSESTIRNWCIEHGLGRKIGGQWMVSRVALDMFLNDDDAALKAYHAGVRSSDPVANYFRRLGLKELLTLPGF
jgi:Helix-turn-helix domain